MKLVSELKRYRLEKSTELGLPSYRVYSNNVLNEIASKRPGTGTTLLSIKGLGKKTYENYGEDILRICLDQSLTFDESDKITVSTNVSDKSLIFEPIQKELLDTLPLPANIDFSEEQIKSIAVTDSGSNVFITGPGGTGKSLLIKYLIERYSTFKKLMVCALTGVAAELLDCNAKTIHAWSSIIHQNNDINSIYNILKRNKSSISAWKNIDILIVDEVSMMSKKYFELLDGVGKKIRNNDKPFGGIQLIFLGDFYQLPPVGDSSSDTGKFCFESVLWQKTFPQVVVLTKIFRQKDKLFTKILQQVRKGGISKNSYEILNARVINKINKNMEIPIISPTKHLVNHTNSRNMNKLNSEEITYTSRVVKSDEIINVSENAINFEINQLYKRMNTDKKITLKEGAHVMCIVNLDMCSTNQIVNGSQGKVIGFVNDIPLVKFKNGVTKLMEYHSWKSEEIVGLAVQQIPLILSWAITIHKSQGITLDEAVIDIGSGIFEKGQSYVALSRVKSLDGLYLINFDHNKIMSNPKVKEYYSSIINE